MKVKVYRPNLLGLEMKFMFIWKALTATKTSEPTWLLRPLRVWTRSGLKICAACCNSGTHSPFLLLVASWEGTQPSGPVPVTSTLLAPNSNNLCFTIYVPLKSIQHSISKSEQVELSVMGHNFWLGRKKFAFGFFHSLAQSWASLPQASWSVH